MNELLMVLGAAIFSGSFLFLMVLLLDRKFSNRISPKQVYLLMKVSLIYFCLPGILILAYMGRNNVQVIQLENAADIEQIFIYHGFSSAELVRRYGMDAQAVNLIFAVWMTGAVVSVIGIQFYKGYHFYRLLKSCVPVKNSVMTDLMNQVASRYGMKKKFTLYQSPCITSPFLAGIMKPKIVLPAVELTEEELEIIFMHEMMHNQGKDAVFRILMGIIQGINWFNPFIRKISHLFYDYGELACDEKVSESMTASQRKSYAYLLHKLSEYSLMVSGMSAFSNDSERFLKRRIFIIMKGTKIRKTAAVSIAAFTFTALSCPLVSLAASGGALYINNELMGAVIEARSTEEVYTEPEYVEYYENAEVLNNICTIIEGFDRGKNSVDVEVPAGESVVTSEVTVTAGGKIRIIVSGDYVSDTFRAGIIDSYGNLRYVDSDDGMVSYIFNMETAGTYQVYFENRGNSALHVSGNVYVD